MKKVLLGGVAALALTASMAMAENAVQMSNRIGVEAQAKMAPLGPVGALLGLGIGIISFIFTPFVAAVQGDN